MPVFLTARPPDPPGWLDVDTSAEAVFVRQYTEQVRSPSGELPSLVLDFQSDGPVAAVWAPILP